MLLLALLLVADLSLFTADPATVEEFAKKLDEGVPWVDEFGQPAAGEWEGKVGSEEELAVGWPVHERNAEQGIWDFNARRNTYTLNGTPTLYLGISGFADTPFTPIDGRQFLFAEIPARHSPSFAINPHQWPDDLGTAYVSFVRRNTSSQADFEENVMATLVDAGFHGWGMRAAIESGLPAMYLIPTEPLRTISDVENVPLDEPPPAIGWLIDATDLPSAADTAALLAGSNTPTKQEVVGFAARTGRMPKWWEALHLDARRLLDNPIEIDGDELAVANEVHQKLLAETLIIRLAQRWNHSPPPAARLVEGIDGLAEDEVGGPVVLVITLPLAAPGFAGMSEDEAVKRWRAAVRTARKDDRVVAVLWGRFWDDPVTGIGPKTDDVRLVQGRAEAAGLWDVTGRPKLSLLKRLNAESDPTDPREDDERE